VIRALWFFFKLALLVAAAVWLANHPGHVTFNWQGYEITTSVAVLAVGMVGIIILSIVLYSVWRAVVGVPGSLSLAHLSRRQRKGYMMLTQGLMAVAAGDAVAARKLAYKAEHLLKEPSLTLLLQAQAAQLAGDENSTSRYYAQMLERPEMSFLGLRGLITQAIKRGDDAHALTLVRRAQLLQPKAEWVLTLLVDLEARAGHWEPALEALGKAGRSGAIPPDKVRKMRCILLLGQAEAQIARNFHEDASYTARKAHELMPGYVPAALVYVQTLLKTDRAKAALKVIERVWRVHPHPELAAYYAEAQGDVQPSAMVRQMERLASYNPDALESHIAVAQAALKAQLWGIAQDRLKKAQAKGPNARVFALSAELAEKESGDPLKGQDWRLKVPTAPVEAGWSCASCQTPAPRWSVRCAHCGAIGEVDWRAGSASLGGVKSLTLKAETPLQITSAQ